MKSNKLDDRMIERILTLLRKPDTTMADVAFAIGVSERTLYYWASDNKEFRKKIYEAKNFADEMVELSLWQRAVGYSHKSEKIFLSKSGDIVRADTVQHYPPDTGAAQFWLKNRDPEKWKDKTEVEHSGKIQQLSDEELDKQIEEKLAKLKK